MEIAEEDEDEVQQPAKRQSLIKENDENKESTDKRRSVTGPDITLNKESTEPKFSESSTTDVPNFVGAAAGTGEEASTGVTGGEGRRLSSQSSRAEVFTSYSSYSAYAYSKPKVKLGPRPSLDTNTRPQTAGNFRPVSSIPAGFKLFGKNGSGTTATGKSKSGRKNSIDSQNSGVLASPTSEITDISFATLPIPEEPSVKNAIESARPATSSGVSTKSGMTIGSKAAMTPEKARLKKAMALREKKKKKAAKEGKDTLEVPTTTTTDDRSDAEGEAEQQEPEAGETANTTADAAERTPMVKADSAIAIDASPASTKDSETTQDSRPTSPAEEQSTKASSVSESTEQAVEAQTEAKGEDLSSSGSTPKPTEGEAETSIPTITEPVEAPTTSEVPVVEIAEGEKAEEAPKATEAEPEVAGTGDKEMEEITPPATAASANKPEIVEVEAAEPEAEPVAAPADDIPVEPKEAIPAQPTQDSPQPETQSVPDPSRPQATDDSDTETISQPTKQSSTRRRPIEPIRTDLAQKDRPVSTTQTELNFSDNDELLDELHEATVEEAKPMLVTKTPLTPVFPGKPSAFGASPTSPPSTAGGHKSTMVRTVSNPVRGNLVAINSDVSQSSARSVSQGAAYLHQITQQRNGDSLAKKQGGTVGGSIANRIKALELLSVNNAETASQPGSRPSSQFFSVKKDRVPSRSPSLVDRANSLTRDTRPSTAQSRENSPEATRFNRDRSGSISSRLSMFEPANSPGNTPRGRPETISVTAKIIRDSPSTSRNRGDGPMELKQSPLLVDHHQQDHPSTPDLAVEEPEASRPADTTRDTDSRRSSFSMMRDFLKEGRKSISSPSTDNLSATNNTHRPPSTHQNSSFSHRLSISSRRSLSKDRDGVASILSDDESTSDKKPSRTSRLMRRLSSLSGGSRNNNANSKISSPPLGTPTVTEEILPTQSSASPVATYMGDVNVQFPDTLLWKRRIMYLDSQGYVILSALPQTQGGTKNKTMGVKRYHLGEFRTPYTPDVEVQELPNSVVLDLVEGSSVQVACEDRTGQMNVLQSECRRLFKPFVFFSVLTYSTVLRDAHAAYAGQ